jgi:protein pelota
MFLEAQRQDIKVVLENKNKFILVHSSTGHKHSLKEVLSDPSVSNKLADTKASGEVKVGKVWEFNVNL